MFRPLVLCLMLTGLVAAPAAAQTGVGVRAGVSGDPDQFVFGGHFETQPLIENLTFRPNVEFGVGDDLTLAAINLEFAYWIPIEDTAWRLYFGGGPAVNFYNFDDDRFGNRDSEVEGGFNIMLGVQHQRGLFTELKIGALDSPDIKFVVGFAFR